jgi:hypothetical protein
MTGTRHSSNALRDGQQVRPGQTSKPPKASAAFLDKLPRRYGDF